jgi:hypothetical protein
VRIAVILGPDGFPDALQVVFYAVNQRHPAQLPTRVLAQGGGKDLLSTFDDI